MPDSSNEQPYDLEVVENNYTLTISGLGATGLQGPVGPEGPEGPEGPAAPNSVTSSTTSDGTANLVVAGLEVAGNVGADSFSGSVAFLSEAFINEGTFDAASVTGILTADHIHGNLAGSVYLHVRAGEALSKGDPVYVSSSHGTGSEMVPIVMRADASNPAKMPAIAIMDADVANNGSGHAVISGTIADLDTADYSINSTLYVDEGGGMTATKPTNAQPVARVERSNANNGGIVVKVNGLYSDISPANIGAVAITDPRLTDERTPLDNSATNAKLADMPGGSLKGRSTGAGGDPEDLTGASLAPILGVALSAGPEDTTPADADRIAVVLPSAGWLSLSRLFTYIKGKIEASFLAIRTVTESTTARTLSAADLGTKIRATNASGLAITIPANLGVAGAAIIVRRATGAGAITLINPGVTVNNSAVASIAAGQEFALVAVDANTWDFVGGNNLGRTLITDAVAGTASDQSLRVDTAWSTTGTPTALQVNVTSDTGPSNANSLLADFQVGGVSRLRVTKTGGLVSTMQQTSALNLLTWGNGSYYLRGDGLFQGSSFLVEGLHSRLVPNGLELRSTAGISWKSGDVVTTSSDLFVVRDTANTLAQRNGLNAQAFRVYDTFASATDFHRVAIATARATATMTGASVTLTGLIPAGAVIMGVTTKVTTAVTGATGYSVGTAANSTRFGSNIAPALGTTSDNRNWTSGAIECFPTATDIVLTAVGSNFTAGVVYVSVQFMTGQAD